jgi:nicotinamide-nucleotide amidase
MDIEVICTGDEVLTGKIVNSNFSYITQKLEDFGLAVRRGVTVGDNREDLLNAFRESGERADVVIVNGGLGPTVDDLSQEVAAQAAGVELELNEEWMNRMREYFGARGRTMPENNNKQAMLPKGAELVDNPIGTACGFGVNIGRAVFYFTPGVPRELRRMMEEELVPRLLKKSGTQAVIILKRFHSYGLGESHVDSLLGGLEEMVPDGSLKLGFRAHYPQLETKLTIQARDMNEARAKLEPVEAELRSRIGNFILAEDDDTLEGVVRKLLLERESTLAVVEDFTGGQITARLSPLPDAGQFLARGIVVPSAQSKMESFAEDGEMGAANWEPGISVAESLAQRCRDRTGASHGLSVLCQVVPDESRLAGNMSGSIYIAIATESEVVHRRARLAGNRDWVRLGAVEMGMDSLRRYLLGLPVHEKTDFERTPTR